MPRTIYIETDRLLLGEMMPEDAEALFELDSDPEVHKYLIDPVHRDIVETRNVIEDIRRQYRENGIGRWAVIEKATGKFIGWSGLKIARGPLNGHSNYFDVGYRLLRRKWGKGFATESVIASLEYSFTELGLQVIYADADHRHRASANVLKKAGLRFIETYDDDGFAVDWFRITREEWDRTRTSGI